MAAQNLNHQQQQSDRVWTFLPVGTFYFIPQYLNSYAVLQL